MIKPRPAGLPKCIHSCIYSSMLAVSPEDFRRLERYLPRGLANPGTENPVDRAMGYLAQLVLSQRLIPGEKVPMDAIAERIGASRTPVREALRLLETEGL